MVWYPIFLWVMSKSRYSEKLWSYLENFVRVIKDTFCRNRSLGPQMRYEGYLSNWRKLDPVRLLYCFLYRNFFFLTRYFLSKRCTLEKVAREFVGISPIFTPDFGFTSWNWQKFARSCLRPVFRLKICTCHFSLRRWFFANSLRDENVKDSNG